ncbi:glutathione S-transferase [Hyphobacterium sp. HN65]|uniref:Glutathione S-transferase n=1 Tax=Hyphobacterium lacteum TaxID=3116575 RepID=A0ABU7LUL4_9PROT|nr:glutathione S-transferase [Hyphobacterium sp. HN65]MEE2527229.1 glutathione S-transferase [Hyphobacterium sp. HN65]
MMQDHVFYDCATAPSPRRARMVFAEKALEVPTVQVDLRHGEQLGEAFRAINPRCTVPALKLPDGTVLGDNASIARYIEEIRPEPPLMGRTPVEKAIIAEWNAIVEFEGLMGIAEVVRNALPGMKGRGLTGPKSYEQIPELAERGRARVTQFFVTLENRLAESAYVGGDAFSLADITAFVAVEFASWVKMVPDENQAALAEWRQAVSERPSAKA